MSRIILSHAIHTKMIQSEVIYNNAKGILRLNCVVEDREIVKRMFLQSSFVNAFGDKQAIQTVSDELDQYIEYSKNELMIFPGDILFVPVIEDREIMYWLKIIVTDAMFLGKR